MEAERGEQAIAYKWFLSTRTIYSRNFERKSVVGRPITALIG